MPPILTSLMSEGLSGATDKKLIFASFSGRMGFRRANRKNLRRHDCRHGRLTGIIAGRPEKGKWARVESSIAKGYACEGAVRVASKAMEIHGAMGIDENHPVERYLRDGGR